jgi:hypothetical protein
MISAMVMTLRAAHLADHGGGLCAGAALTHFHEVGGFNFWQRLGAAGGSLSQPASSSPRRRCAGERWARRQLHVAHAGRARTGLIGLRRRPSN